MKAFWSDPYMWIHLAGIAAVPFWLFICGLGLAAGDPILPIGLEVFLVAILGIVPIALMQWQRPFCIYSLLFVGLRPAAMTIDQRRMLSLFKSRRSTSALAGMAIILVGRCDEHNFCTGSFSGVIAGDREFFGGKFISASAAECDSGNAGQ
jgi:hypothetical protein